jgi:hypothetical protein
MTQADRMADYNRAQERQRHLKQKVRRRVTTAFIAALAEFETQFGSHLWGKDLPPYSRTDAQREMWEAYQRVRAAVLDRGNEQARGAERDVEDFLKED